MCLELNFKIPDDNIVKYRNHYYIRGVRNFMYQVYLGKKVLVSPNISYVYRFNLEDIGLHTITNMEEQSVYCRFKDYSGNFITVNHLELNLGYHSNFYRKGMICYSYKDMFSGELYKSSVVLPVLVSVYDLQFSGNSGDFVSRTFFIPKPGLVDVFFDICNDKLVSYEKLYDELYSRYVRK